jgi:hypothetical protein
MDTKKNDHKEHVIVGSERVYTQGEVDDLMEKKENSLSSPAKELKEEVKSADKQKRQENRTVAKLVKKSNRILVSISAQFPFDFFPDTINVEEGRVTVIKRGMLSSDVHSVDLKDVSNIFVNGTIFFSELIIVSKTFEDNEVRIRYLKPKEAVFIRRIIEGLRIFESKQIDTSTYSKEDLIAKLEELSKTEIVK